MTGPRTLELDTFGLAVGTALIAGGLSVVASFLAALVGALAALALASWAMALGPDRWTRGRWRSSGPGLAALALGALGFLHPPTGLIAYRGLVLALGLVPLWVLERRASERPVRAPRVE